MIRASYGDIDLVSSLLTDSFENNQSVNYIVKQDTKRIQRIKSLMEYSFKVCAKSGEIWLSEDLNACALILYPHQKRRTLKSFLLIVKLIFQVIGLDGVKKALIREAQIKKKRPKEKMAYLWFIGVDPNEQGKGLGNSLLQQVFLETEKKGLSIYLETSTLKNISWYKRLGFQMYDRLELNYTLYFLKRELVK